MATRIINTGSQKFGLARSSAGARYEGQWTKDDKHGEGIYVFEDNSVWKGMWEHDQPIESANTQPFAAQSTCPKVYVQDLLDHELNYSFASKGAPFTFKFSLDCCFHWNMSHYPSSIAVPKHQTGQGSRKPCITLLSRDGNSELSPPVNAIAVLYAVYGLAALHRNSARQH